LFYSSFPQNHYVQMDIEYYIYTKGTSLTKKLYNFISPDVFNMMITRSDDLKFTSVNKDVK